MHPSAGSRSARSMSAFASRAIRQAMKRVTVQTSQLELDRRSKPSRMQAPRAESQCLPSQTSRACSSPTSETSSAQRQRLRRATDSNHSRWACGRILRRRWSQRRYRHHKSFRLVSQELASRTLCLISPLWRSDTPLPPRFSSTRRLRREARGRCPELPSRHRRISRIVIAEAVSNTPRHGHRICIVPILIVCVP